MAISIDGPNRLLILSTGTVAVTVPALYSAWVDWVAASDNAKFLPAFRTVGGDDIDSAAGTKVPPYCYLLNGWKVRPQEANHTLKITDGILLVDGGGDPIADTIGAFKVRVSYSQPVQAITVATGGGTAPSASQVADAVWAHSSALTLEDRVLICAKILRNKTITDPTTGVMTVYDDNGSTVLFTAQMYEGAVVGQTYRGQGAERRERLA